MLTDFKKLDILNSIPKTIDISHVVMKVAICISRVHNISYELLCTYMK